VKIIHVSDLHIDSKMETNFSPLIAKQRNNEILVTFENLIELMQEDNYDIMIIAGDMFDTKKISSKAFTYIIDLFAKNKSKKFFYVAGNHDKETTLINDHQELPNNLFVFNDKFSKYMVSDCICIGGKQLTNSNASTFGNDIEFHKDNINFMVAHGSITKIANNTNNSNFLASQITNKNIDYLALGHIHSYATEKIGKRGIYVYPGCLEPRGYDEIGEKGFVKIEINEQSKTILHTFIPFSSRTFHEINIDISECSSTREILDQIYNQTKNIKEADGLKVIITGQFCSTLFKSIQLIEEELNSKFYTVKVVDKSTLKINPSEYENDMTLKGFFIRKVLSSNLTEQDKSEVIITGLKSLSGEDI